MFGDSECSRDENPAFTPAQPCPHCAHAPSPTSLSLTVFNKAAAAAAAAADEARAAAAAAQERATRQAEQMNASSLFANLEAVMAATPGQLVAEARENESVIAVTNNLTKAFATEATADPFGGIDPFGSLEGSGGGGGSGGWDPFGTVQAPAAQPPPPPPSSSELAAAVAAYLGECGIFRQSNPTPIYFLLYFFFQFK